MSSMLEQLWPVFLAEVTEQLESLALRLDRRAEPPDVNALFRDFHTLKSSFSMVDLRLLVDLAHACEDVLHGVRRQNNAVTPDIKMLLLETVDWLKQQLALASPGQYPDQPNDSLLARLAPFRPAHTDDDSDSTITTTAIPPPAEPMPKSESLLEQERDALAVTHLRVSSDALDELVTQVNAMSRDAAALVNCLHDDSTLALLTTLKQQQTDHAPSTQAVQTLLQQCATIDDALHNALDTVQQSILTLREIPLSTVLNRLPRIVRRRAGELDKPTQLLMSGGDLLIDKGMIDEITEPLVHILQNAIDHGIETQAERADAGKPPMATLQITASERDGRLCIEVEDDGRGIDWRTVREKVLQKGLGNATDERPDYWLAFLFSREYHEHGYTAGASASGLDRVRQRLTAIGGAMDIRSEAGKGTRMIMHIPVSLAIQRVMLAEAAGQTFALPLRHIGEVTRLRTALVDDMAGQPVMELRGNPLPLYPLGHLLDLPQADEQLDDRQDVMVVHHGSRCIGLVVDRIHSRQELFLRELHADLRTIPGVGGASLLGNGEVVIILDPDALFSLASRRPWHWPAANVEA